MKSISSILSDSNGTLLDVLKQFESASNHGLPSGIVLIIDSSNKLIGTVTEGDIRRAQLNGFDLNTSVDHIMQKDPIFFNEGLTLTKIIEEIPLELKKRNRKSARYLSKIILVNSNNEPVKVVEYHELWEQKVATHRHLVVVGLGYVGLTMAVVMADAGFMVTGVERDKERVRLLNEGTSYIHEVGLEDLLKEQIHKNFIVDYQIPKEGDVYIISVGTPIENIGGSLQPNMMYLRDACESIGSKLERGNLVVLRSTVPIGTCRNFVLPILESASGLKCGFDFNLSFAPERTAEGKALKELRSLPQIIGGFDKNSLEATTAIFRDLTPTIVKVDSLESAEMAKLINNSFRDYIFAYANQMAKIAAGFNIDVFKVIKAANEGYVRDPVPLPSPGVGGPCLTKDPHIFASVAKEHGQDTDLFTRSRSINESMHNLVFERVFTELKRLGKQISNAKILICGLAFKGYPETGDIRNSSGVEIGQMFMSHSNNIFAFDPVANESEMIDAGFKAVSFEFAFNEMDVVLFLNNHKKFEQLNIYQAVRAMNDFPIVFDGWNLFNSHDVISIRACSYLGLSTFHTTIDL
jgi:UDP-N-acetyl-D-mannosaminuronic acid dehydrogenase